MPRRQITASARSPDGSGAHPTRASSHCGAPAGLSTLPPDRFQKGRAGSHLRPRACRSSDLRYARDSGSQDDSPHSPRPQGQLRQEGDEGGAAAGASAAHPGQGVDRQNPPRAEGAPHPAAHLRRATGRNTRSPCRAEETKDGWRRLGHRGRTGSKSRRSAPGWSNNHCERTNWGPKSHRRPQGALHSTVHARHRGL